MTAPETSPSRWRATETLLLHLVAAGLRLAIDDFGTGRHPARDRQPARA